MASRRTAHSTRAQASSKRREITKPTAGIGRFLQASAVLQDTFSFEQQIVQVLDAAREVLAVDRVHIWAVAPQGDQLIHVASSGLSESDRQSLGRGMEIPVAEAGAMARAYRGKLSFVVDETHPLPLKSRLKPPYSAVEALRTKSFAIVPIVARGRSLGVLVADNKYRRTPLPADKLHLLPVFALHLATAVDNVGLITELHTRDRTLAETTEQQTATSEILRVISNSPTDLQPVLDAVAERAARLCDANDVVIVRVDGDVSRLAAHYGTLATIAVDEPMPIRHDLVSGRAIIERRVVHIPDVLTEPSSEFAAARAYAARFGYRTNLAVPMLREGKAVGAMIIRRIGVRPFSDKQIDLLKTFADQAVIAIENTRLFNELQTRNRDLTESLEQQTATSEILRVISQSQRDVQPVFEAIAANARKLCEAIFGSVWTYDGESVKPAAVSSAPDKLETLRRMFPTPPVGLPHRRAILTRAVVYVPDVREDPEYDLKDLAETLGFRSVVSVPMLRDGKPIGTIGVSAPEAAMFSERQIAMLQTFADQAVIAIENTRLFKELQTRNRDLTEALEQQTATSEVLKVMSRSTFDLDPVLATLIANATMLCHAEQGFIFRFDGEFSRLVASHNTTPEFRAFVDSHPIPPGRGTLVGRVVLERSAIHIPDAVADPEYEWRESQTLGRFRTMLGIPMLRQGVPIGVIALWRGMVQPFSPKEIELVTTFADQAVIAIENTRLFNELKERLEQQTATSEILRVISSSPTDLQPVLDAVVASAARLCNANDASIFRVDGDAFRTAAHCGSIPVSPPEQRIQIVRGVVTGRVILDRCVLHIADVLAEPDSEFAGSKAFAARLGYRTFLAAPMLREGTAIGAIAIRRTDVRPFTESQIAMLKTFADQAVIAIENTRLFNELQTRNRDLTESLEQQTATSEILRVISQSQRDVQPVFETIAANARKLCEAAFAVVSRFDGELIHLAAVEGYSPEGLEELHQAYPMPPSRGVTGARALLTRAVVYIPDVREDAEYPLQSLARTAGFRSSVAVPMLRDGSPIGAISVAGAEPGMFSERQIAMLQTFADQAVIAIENTRLFNELQTRNRDLTESLEQQTATSEILRVISQSQRDVQPVFQAIAANARRLCRAEHGGVYAFDGNLLHLAAIDTVSPEAREAALRDFPKPPGSSNTQALALQIRAPFYNPDVLADPAYELPSRAKAIGYRSACTVPMLRDGSPFGLITVTGAEPNMFSERQIAMLQTFADQAVIAIENTRLFNELQTRNRDLTDSLEQQTATSEILRVISQSQQDVEPVFRVIVANATKLCNGTHSVFYTFDGEVVSYAASDGQNLEAEEETRRTFPMTPNRGSALGRSLLDRRVTYIPDIREDVDYRLTKLASLAGYLSTVSVPMLRNGKPLGAISVCGAEPGMFSERQIAMLQTFTDQALIAIENTRLFNELQTRNRDLTESLEQQTATSEILRAISSSPTDLASVLVTVAQTAARLCSGNDAAIYRLDGDLLRPIATTGHLPAHPLPLKRGTVTGRAVIDRSTVHVRDIFEVIDTEFPDARPFQAVVGFRTILATPLLREGAAIGAIIIRRTEVQPFSESQIALLKTFADQAVIAIENTRLFNELQTRNRDLTESLEQQTATSEILRVISQSQSDVQPVFETIAANARKLCDATFGGVWTYDGELLHLAATAGFSTNGLEAVRRSYPMRPGRGAANARSILTRDVVYIPDVREDPEYESFGVAQAAGFLSVIAVPMLRDGSPIGAITVTGAEPAMFTERQIAMLQTFADQAVIAVENTRLFTELQARTAELGRSVEELKALGEVGSAVSSTLDLDTVLTTILTHANQLAGTQAGQIFDYDEETEELRPRSTIGYTQDIADALRRNPIRKGEGVTGQAVLKRQPVQVPDIATEGAYDSRLRDLIMDSGFRALLAVPLIREDQVMGALAIARRTPGEFPTQVVDLLTTFASQSALAMQNARLFHQLEIASQHKSTFLANMSHELRTPLNAVIGYSEMLQEDAVDVGADGLVPDLKKVNAAGKHLLELINSILDLSKIEAGKMELHLEDFSVARMIEDIASMIQPLAEKNGNRLAVTCDAETGVMHADLTKVRQVLFNLLSNACKFTEKGTVSLAVRREGPDSDAWLTFTVEDTGIGLNAEQLGRLFQEFSQADTTTARKYGGTGLGLALSRRLCRLMGGEITVTSEPDRGSTFTVRLPTDVAQIRERAAEAAGDAGMVLVIDDEAVVRELMQRFLSKQGFRVLTASNGEDGLRLARSQRPDAITLDVMMPGMDGWTVLLKLMADRELADVPVIMLTIVDDKQMGYALGASEYLTKPIDRERLIAVLNKYRRDLPVLVVDDDAGVRLLLRRILEAEGYAVIEAENGLTALARLGERTPGAILLDLMMPQMDGFEFLSALHERATWRQIPVVIVTAKDLTVEEHERLSGSVVRILQKGAYGQEDLLAEVRALLAASIGRRKGTGT